MGEIMCKIVFPCHIISLLYIHVYSKRTEYELCFRKSLSQISTWYQSRFSEFLNYLQIQLCCHGRSLGRMSLTLAQDLYTSKLFR